MSRNGKNNRKSSSKNGSDGRTPALVRAMEQVFRSTHDREMTVKERQEFRLPASQTGTRNVTSK